MRHDEEHQSLVTPTSGETSNSETSPLLGSPSPAVSEDSVLRPAPQHSSKFAWQCILAAAAVQLLLNIGSHISMVPQTSILQDIVCRKYYAEVDDIPGADRCKAEAVQSEMAYIMGWQEAIETIPTVFLTIPFGILADRIGRKKVLLLSITGLFMNDAWIRLVYWFDTIIPTRLVWLAGLWQILGAGSATLSSLTYVLVADTCPTEQRTVAFSQLRSAKLISQLVFVPVGGFIALHNPWIAMFIASGFMVLGFAAAALLVPETLPMASSPQTGDGSVPDEVPREQGESNEGRTNIKSSSSNQHAVTRFVTKLCSWILDHPRTIPVVLSFFFFQLGEQANGTLLLQYVAKRLDWSLGKASFMISVRASVDLAVLSLVIPVLSLWLSKASNTIVKDMRIAQISGAFLVSGTSVIFAAATPWLMVVGHILSSLGDVFSLPVRTIATNMVEQHHLGALYTIIEFLTQCGVFVGHPVLAKMFQWGMKAGEGWLGLPFLFSTVCFLVSVALACTAPMRTESSYEPNEPNVGPRE